MRNKSTEKTPMPEQKPEERIKNFNEVALGYTEEMAISEANRCLQCKNEPCVSGCPVNVQIPDFIKLVAEGKFEEAYQKIAETNSLPAICGRVCPQETQCEKKCVKGIKGEPVGIGRLERFASDFHIKNHTENTVAAPETNGHKVAVIGAGPAGLTCAGDLASMGYEVTIFEALHTPGGVLMYGIPEFRLPKEIVQKEIDGLKALGVNIDVNIVIGKTLLIDELFDEGFEAVFIGSGAGLPNFQKIPGESLNGSYSANEFLTRINLMKAYKKGADTPLNDMRKVAVIGGGNVAMDAARSAKRMGAEDVYIVYRRSEKEMPARLEEIHHAKEEGIIFNLLVNPVEIHGDEKGFVKQIECVKMELGEPDDSGRRRPIVIEGSNFLLDVDTVVVAIGNSPNPLISKTTKGLKTNRWGCIETDDRCETSIKRVYAGGDIVTGAATVILAMGAGKQAAKSIDEDICKADQLD